MAFLFEGNEFDYSRGIFNLAMPHQADRNAR